MNEVDPLLDFQEPAPPTASDNAFSPSVTILFKIPQEHIQNIELTFPLSASMEVVKQEIEKKHQVKPKPAK